jgi:hypothetical protein
MAAFAVHTESFFVVFCRLWQASKAGAPNLSSSAELRAALMSAYGNRKKEEHKSGDCGRPKAKKDIKASYEWVSR